MRKVNSVQLQDERAQLKRKAQDIIDLCKKEVRDLTEEEEKEIEDLKGQIKEKDEELKALQQRIAELSVEDEEKEPQEKDKKEENKRSINTNNTMNKNFSLVKAIRSIANNQQLDEVSMAVINAGKEEARKSGISTQGQIQIPSEMRSTITVTAEGEDVVATELFDLLKPLRAKNVLAQAGAKFLTGLVGNVQVPIMTAENVGWAGEVADASDGAGTFSHITLTPKRLTAYIDISKQMLVQDSIDVENAIREDLINAINSKLEETILGDGDGKAGGASVVAPIGMLNGVTPTEVADFATLCEVESDIEDANVIGECKYVMSNKCKAALRGMIKGTNATGMVYENNAVDGTSALNTSHMGTDKLFIYGDWSNLAVGSWGNLDITVDPYSKAAAGQVRIVVNAFFDAVVLRDDAFAYGEVVTE